MRPWQKGQKEDVHLFCDDARKQHLQCMHAVGVVADLHHGARLVELLRQWQPGQTVRHLLPARLLWARICTDACTVKRPT